MKKILVVVLVIFAIVLVVGLVSSTSDLIKTNVGTSADSESSSGSDVPADTEEPEAKTISFSIDGVKYLATEDTTWGEWIAGYYGSQAGFYIYNLNILSSTKNIVQLDGVDVLNTDKIQKGVAYFTATPVSKESISFYIDNESYHATEVMTWDEWLGNEGETSGFHLDDEYIVLGENFYLVLNSNFVHSSDLIQSEGDYIFSEFFKFTLDIDVGETISEYFFTEGSTWKEWIESSFNTDGIFIQSEAYGGDLEVSVIQHPCDDFKAIVDPVDGDPVDGYVHPFDVLIPGHCYSLYTW